MTPGISYETGVPPPPAALCDLRVAVGWDRAEADYPDAFRAFETFVTARDGGGDRIGWVAALSDGVRHGFLLDMMVKPAWQRRGIGRELVRRAVAVLRDRGIRIVHVDFVAGRDAFYRRCGFRPSRAGILEMTAAPGE